MPIPSAVLARSPVVGDARHPPRPEGRVALSAISGRFRANPMASASNVARKRPDLSRNSLARDLETFVDGLYLRLWERLSLRNPGVVGSTAQQEPEPDAVGAGRRVEVVAVPGEQAVLGLIVVPAPAAQRAFPLVLLPIVGPFPDVAGDAVEAPVVLAAFLDRTGDRVAVVIASICGPGRGFCSTSRRSPSSR